MGWYDSGLAGGLDNLVRVDVLSGFTTLRPEMAAQWVPDGTQRQQLAIQQMAMQQQLGQMAQMSYYPNPPMPAPKSTPAPPAIRDAARRPERKFRIEE